MIVCVCMVASDREVTRAIADGAHTVEQVGARCGAGTGCGACQDSIQSMLEKAGAGCPGGGRCGECRGAATAAPLRHRESRHAA